MKNTQFEAFLQEIPADYQQQAYELKAFSRVEGYVHAIPLPYEQAEKVRRKAQQRAKEKGRTASTEVLYTSGWVLVFTALPLTALSTMEAAKLYRVCWQVE